MQCILSQLLTLNFFLLSFIRSFPLPLTVVSEKFVFICFFFSFYCCCCFGSWRFTEMDKKVLIANKPNYFSSFWLLTIFIWYEWANLRIEWKKVRHDIRERAVNMKKSNDDNGDGGQQHQHHHREYITRNSTELRGHLANVPKRKRENPLKTNCIATTAPCIVIFCNCFVLLFTVNDLFAKLNNGQYEKTEYKAFLADISIWIRQYGFTNRIRAIWKVILNHNTCAHK